jgi:hypothetical protein
MAEGQVCEREGRARCAVCSGNDYDEIVGGLLGKASGRKIGKVAVINFSYIDAESNSRGAEIVSERILDRVL